MLTSSVFAFGILTCVTCSFFFVRKNACCTPAPPCPLVFSVYFFFFFANYLLVLSFQFNQISYAECSRLITHLHYHQQPPSSRKQCSFSKCVRLWLVHWHAKWDISQQEMTCWGMKWRHKCWTFKWNGAKFFLISEFQHFVAYLFEMSCCKK